MKKSRQPLVAKLGAALVLICSPISYAAPNPNFADAHFSGSGKCTQCHDGLSDAQGADVSIVKNWSSSMMANSTRDPYWRAKVASELHRNPQLSDDINDKCSRCHAPMANDAMKKDNVPVELFGDGMLNPSNDYFNHALDGVSCTSCHQISDSESLGTLEGFSGKFSILDYAGSVDRPLFGQFSDPVANPMISAVGFTPTHSAHISDSKVCATCHNLKTAFIDSSGSVASTTPESEFPEQMVYTEWENSAFTNGGANEKSCQTCHMPKLDDPVKIASRPQNVTARDGFSQHTFLGANTVMLDILNNNKDELEVQATGFEEAISDTREMLKTSATLNIISSEIIDDKLKVVINITNAVGHKFPTSFPSRRAFIHFQVKDENGVVIFESGKLNTDGSIEGNTGDFDTASYEPHYDLITDDSQVQVYEPIMLDTDGNVTYTLLRAATYAKDNRITPQGFDKLTVPNDVAIKGLAFNDANFNLGEDTITYMVDILPNTNPVITAELMYQAIAYSHMSDIFKDADEVPEVLAFKRYYDNASIRAELIASDTQTVVDTGAPDGSADNPSDTPQDASEVTGDNTSGGGSFSVLMMLLLGLFRLAATAVSPPTVSPSLRKLTGVIRD